MTKILLCFLGLLVLSTQAKDNDFKAVSKFDASKLVGTWYENIYADTLPAVLQACVTYVFTKDDEDLIMQYAYNQGGLDGDIESRLIQLKQQGKSGRFSANNKSLGRKGEWFILDHADNWDWIAVADTTGDADSTFLSVFSRGQRNLDGIERLVELAGKYNKNSHHLDLQTDKCDYKDLLAQMKDDRS